MDSAQLAFLDVLPALTEAVSLEPDTFANQLIRRNLIPRRTWQNALSPTMSPDNKSNQIMVALQTRLSTDPSSVNRLLEALRAVPTLASIADRMQRAMGQETESATSPPTDQSSVSLSSTTSSTASIPPVAKTQSSSSYDDLSGLDYEPEDVTQLIEKVGHRVASRWKAFARQLHFTEDELDEIQGQFMDNQERINQVFALWKDKASVPYTWAHLIQVLEKNAVRENTLATELRQDLERMNL